MDYNLHNDIFDKIFYNIKLWFVPFSDNRYSPKFLNSKLLFYVVILIVFAKIIFISVSLNFPKYTFFADISKIELQNMVNSQRRAIGLTPLAENTKLDQAAMLKAQDMINNGYFAHQSPTGVTPWFWFKKIGYNYKYAGENLAIGFFESSDVYNAWFDSDSHRNNFLSSNYTEVGTAILTGNFDGAPATVVVQLFGKQKPLATSTVKTTQTTVTTNTSKDLPSQTSSTKPVNIIIDKKTVLGAEDNIISIKEASPESKNSLKSQILNAIFYSYEELLQKSVFVLFLLVSIISIMNILINYNFQNRKLVLKSFAMVLILLIGISLDKNLLTLWIS